MNMKSQYRRALVSVRCSNMFGSTSLGIILLDVILLVFGAVLIPMLYSIFKTLRDILVNTNGLTKTLESLCSVVSDITKEITESRIRDVGFQNEIQNLRRDFQHHINGEKG